MTSEACMKLEIDCQPDLVFLDFHLPDCEGDVVLTKLKEHERTKYTPVYILSADARNEQIQRLKNSVPWITWLSLLMQNDSLGSLNLTNP